MNSIISLNLYTVFSFPSVCGDGQCSADIGETCDSCARDCCPPSLAIEDAVGISLGVVVFICAFVTSSILISVTTVSVITC